MAENSTGAGLPFQNDSSPSPPADLGFFANPAHSLVGFWFGMVINPVGIYGNLLVIAAIWWSNKLRQRHNAFMASLAVCDLGAILFCNTLQMAAMRAKGWPFGFGACIVQNAAFIHFNFASMLHVIVIAVYRYLAVAFPFGGLAVQSKKFVVKLLIGIHALTLLLTGVPKIPMIQTLYFNARVAGCMVEGGSTARIMIVVLFSTLIVSTCATVVFAYIKIRLAMKHNPAMPTMSMIERKKSHLSIVVCMVFVLAVVVLGYAPFVALVAVEEGTVGIPKTVSILSIVLFWVANSSNWIIYGLLNRDFRQAYKDLFRRGRMAMPTFVNQVQPVNNGPMIVVHPPFASPPSALWRVEDLRKEDEGGIAKEMSSR